MNNILHVKIFHPLAPDTSPESLGPDAVESGESHIVLSPVTNVTECVAERTIGRWQRTCIFFMSFGPSHGTQWKTIVADIPSYDAT